jgi:hypothetical protein
MRKGLIVTERHLKIMAFVIMMLIAPAFIISCTAVAPGNGGAIASYVLPTEAGSWTPPVLHAGHLPTGTGTVLIDGIGTLTFEASEVETHRPDIFQQGHFSLFDIIVHIADKGDIALDYHFDETMDTHVIGAINGEGGWWYKAHYSQGWYEANVFRMDMYPYKNGTSIHLYKEQPDFLQNVYRTFQEEVSRLSRNGGQVVIPELLIESPDFRFTFRDVVVTPHGVRSDMLQPGVVTALDAIVSLGEQGQLSRLKLTWFESISRADPVDNYWLEQIDEAEAFGGCGFVYETGPRAFSGFRGSHIHIPSDVRVIVSPEYAFWFWICL